MSSSSSSSSAAAAAPSSISSSASSGGGPPRGRGSSSSMSSSSTGAAPMLRMKRRRSRPCDRDALPPIGSALLTSAASGVSFSLGSNASHSRGHTNSAAGHRSAEAGFYHASSSSSSSDDGSTSAGHPSSPNLFQRMTGAKAKAKARRTLPVLAACWLLLGSAFLFSGSSDREVKRSLRAEIPRKKTKFTKFTERKFGFGLPDLHNLKKAVGLKSEGEARSASMDGSNGMRDAAAAAAAALSSSTRETETETSSSVQHHRRAEISDLINPQIRDYYRPLIEPAEDCPLRDLSLLLPMHHKDFPLASTLFYSLEKVFPCFRELIVIVPPESEFALVGGVPSYAKIVVVPEPLPKPFGYLSQQVVKLYADLYTDAERILILEADLIMKSWHDSCFFSVDDRGSYSGRVRAYCSPTGADVWFKGTQHAIGGEEVTMDCCVNSPFAFPREVFPALRTHVEHVHGKPFGDFMADYFEGHSKAWNKNELLFSEFNILQHFMLRFRPDLVELVTPADGDEKFYVERTACSNHVQRERNYDLPNPKLTSTYFDDYYHDLDQAIPPSASNGHMRLDLGYPKGSQPVDPRMRQKMLDDEKLGVGGVVNAYAAAAAAATERRLNGGNGDAVPEARDPFAHGMVVY